MNERNLSKTKNYKLAKLEKKALIATFRTILIIGLCFIILFPIIRAIVLAFTKYEYVALPNSIWLPWKVSDRAFIYAKELLDYKKALVYTLLYSFGLMIIQVLIAAIAGYGLYVMKFKGSKIFMFCVLMTIILPPQLIALPQYMFFKSLRAFGSDGLVNNPLSLFLLAILGQGIRQGIFIYLFRQFYMGLPKELEEAAKMDGCNFLTTFFRIVLPNAKSIIMTVAVFSFVWNFGDTFYTSFFASNANLLSNKLSQINEGSAKQVFMNITGFQTMSKYYFPTILSAANILYITPLLILYFIIQRSFVQNFENSGIVG